MAIPVPDAGTIGQATVATPCQNQLMTQRYVGSGPYCYANSLAMVLADGSDPGLMEVLTGSPFGMQLLGGHTAMFDPLGWDPAIGIDAALDLLGWARERSDGGDEGAAFERLARRPHLWPGPDRPDGDRAPPPPS